MVRDTHQNLEVGGCWQLPASHSFQITYKHKDFSFCGTPNPVHVLLHKYSTQELLLERTHFHSKLRDTWMDPRSHSRRLKTISGFLAPPWVPQCSKPTSMKQGRLRVAWESVPLGLGVGLRMAEEEADASSSVLCSFLLFHLPAHPPTTTSRALCRSQLCFLHSPEAVTWSQWCLHWATDCPLLSWPSIFIPHPKLGAEFRDCSGLGNHPPAELCPSEQHSSSCT